MVKERLSKLQKWILIEAHKKGERENFISKNYFISRREVYEKFFDVRTNPSQRKQDWESYILSKVGYMAVILSRSAKNLERKGFVELKHLYFGGYVVSGKNIIILKEKGIEKAKSLLLIYQEGNNKEKED